MQHLFVMFHINTYIMVFLFFWVLQHLACQDVDRLLRLHLSLPLHLDTSCDTWCDTPHDMCRHSGTWHISISGDLHSRSAHPSPRPACQLHLQGPYPAHRPHPGAVVLDGAKQHHCRLCCCQQWRQRCVSRMLIDTDYAVAKAANATGSADAATSSLLLVAHLPSLSCRMLTARLGLMLPQLTWTLPHH